MLNFGLRCSSTLTLVFYLFVCFCFVLVWFGFCFCFCFFFFVFSVTQFTKEGGYHLRQLENETPQIHVIGTKV